MRSSLILATVFAFGLVGVPAHSSPVTETYSFALGGFVDINGSPALPTPVSQITGSFTVTFDPTQSYDNATAGLVVHSLTGVTVDSTLGFTYDATAHLFFLGGTQNDSDFVVTGTNDFVLAYDVTDLSNPAFVPCSTPGFVCGALTGSPLYDAAGFTTVGNDSLWFITAADSNPVGTTVPEPATAALVLVALLGLAGARRGAIQG